MTTELVLIHGEAIMEDGVRKIVCGFCGWKWTPRKKTPKACPSCKRHLTATDDMLDIRRKKIIATLPEIGDVREAVPDYFTPECITCHNEATIKFKGSFYCGSCVMDKMRETGVIEG